MSDTVTIIGTVKKSDSSLSRIIDEFDFSTPVTEDQLENITIGKGVSDLSLPISDIQPAKLIYIKNTSGSNIKVRINDISNNQIEVGSMLMIQGTNISALYVSNPNPENITIKFYAGA